MASFPGSLLALLNAVDGVTVVHASDVNTLYDELRNGVETALGLNPQTISDAVAPGSTPTDVATYLDMVATQLKAITGGASWYASPATTLAAINTGKVAIPGGVTTGDVLYYNGTIFTRLGIGTAGQILTVSGGLPAWAAAPVTGIPSPGGVTSGDLLYYNGAAWARLGIGTAGYLLTVSGGLPAWVVAPTAGIPPPASPALGDLLVYNGSSWARVGIGTTGQVLQVSGGTAIWGANTGAVLFTDGQWTKWNVTTGSVDVVFRKPIISDSVAGTIQEYLTIQSAVNAWTAANGRVVVIPPGYWQENIVIPDGLVLTEMFRGSVRLAGTITTNAVLTNAWITVSSIEPPTGNNQFALNMNHTSGIVRIYATRILVPPCTGTSGAVSAAGSGGTTQILGCDIQAVGQSGTISAAQISAGATLNLYDCLLTTSNIGTATMWDINNAGTLNLYNTTYTPSKVSGLITFGTGDRQVRSTAATPATTGTMTVPMVDSVKTITPTGNCTFNASGGVTGSECTFVITTSGVSSFTMTFGTAFKSTGTLATGTVSGKVFTVSFMYDGTNWNETGRTTAM